MADSARYLYAVARGLDPASLGDLRGLREAPLVIVRQGQLDAVVSDVPLGEFGEEPLKHNLERLPWLEEVAREHHQVVSEVAARAPTAPMRLATIFLDDDAVRRRVAELHDALDVVLDRIDRRMEWSVKVVAPVPAEEPVAVPRASSGTEFLEQRKQRAGEREERQAVDVRTAEDIHRALSEAAVAARLLPPQDPQLTGYTGPMILNGAYLVAVDDQEAFVSRLREVERTHPEAQIESGGPWPPYSFAVLEQA